jgi:hypothetical protein
MHPPGGLIPPGTFIKRGEVMINENMVILDVLRKFPAAQQVFAKYGMRCLG